MAAGAGGAVLPTLSMAAAGAQTDPSSPSARPGTSPYGPPATEPDENGMLLPAGFASRVIAVAGEDVADTGHPWHLFPDGAATFEADDGGWIYTCNSEVPLALAPANGGVSAVRFDADGTITDAYRILEGSNSNCAGGPTPWGTWLSCEESPLGRVFECDPSGQDDAVARPAMGRFSHEAAAVDPPGKAVYLTEDDPAGLLYRFTPEEWPKLAAGVLEAAIVAEDGAVTWAEVPDPTAADKPTRQQVPGAAAFKGGEGVWHHEGTVYFTTKHDHQVHALDLDAQVMSLVWDGDPDRLGVEGAVLSGVDNITADAGTGDLYVAEDGGNMELVLITPDGVVAPFARLTGKGQEGSEVTGPCFSPDRTRLYFSSQRAPSLKAISEIDPDLGIGAKAGGITYEVTGPFRGSNGSEPDSSPTTTLAKAAGSASRRETGPGAGSGDDDVPVVPIVAGSAVALAAIGGAVVALRRRGSASRPRTS